MRHDCRLICKHEEVVIGAGSIAMVTTGHGGLNEDCALQLALIDEIGRAWEAW
jgi:hypothetical protein